MFWNVYYDLCSRNGTSPSAVAIAVGLSNSIATKWKNGAYPSGDILLKIAEYFNVSTDYLLTGKEKSIYHELSEDKKRLLEMYDNLTDMEKGEILGELKALTKSKSIAVPIAARQGYSEIYVENINHDEIEDFKNAKAQKY